MYTPTHTHPPTTITKLCAEPVSRLGYFLTPVASSGSCPPSLSLDRPDDPPKAARSVCHSLNLFQESIPWEKKQRKVCRPPT